MDIAFQEKFIDCLQEQAVEVLYQEETTELIVPDSCPDVQAILDSTAVCCLRDQEILSGSFTVSGAFQASALYTAEDDGTLWSMDAYLPFTAKLVREEIQSDSRGIAEIRIRSVDARILNSRKIMIRVSYAIRLTVYGTALLKLWDTDGEDGVQLLHEKETGTFPITTASKPVSLLETIELPTAGSQVRKIVKAIPDIQLSESSIIEGRAVLKGLISLHLMYLLEDGQLNCFDVQLPLSQYLELETNPEGGTPWASALLSDFQIDPDEAGGYTVKISIQLQVVIWKQVEISLITDGYCTNREFHAEYEGHRIRQTLDEPSLTRNAEGVIQGTIRKLVDCSAWVDFPVCRREPDEVQVESTAMIHVLYYDESDQLRGETVKAEVKGAFALNDGATCYADADAAGSCYTSPNGAGSTVSCPVSLSARCFAEKQVQGMCAASVGEKTEADTNRPSLIVRRTGGKSLWNIAKSCGTTMQAIREANGISGDSIEEEQLLLIPIA